MLSRDSLEAYRRMTNEQRLHIALQMTRAATPYLLQGPAEQVERRFKLLELQNDLRNRRMLAGIARTRKKR